MKLTAHLNTRDVTKVIDAFNSGLPIYDSDGTKVKSKIQLMANKSNLDRFFILSKDIKADEDLGKCTLCGKAYTRVALKDNSEIKYCTSCKNTDYLDVKTKAEKTIPEKTIVLDVSKPIPELVK